MIFVIYASSVRPRRESRVMRRHFASKTPKKVKKASKFDDISLIFGYFEHKNEHFRVNSRRFRRVRLRREFRVHVRVGRASRQTAS